MTPVPFSYYRTPLILLFIVVLVCIATVIAPPAGQLSWFLEVGPGLAGAMVAAPLFHRLHDRSMARLESQKTMVFFNPKTPAGSG